MKVGADVAWSAKGNGYGTLKVTSRVCGTRVKFVHKSGYVSCRQGLNSVHHARGTNLTLICTCVQELREILTSDAKD